MEDDPDRTVTDWTLLLMFDFIGPFLILGMFIGWIASLFDKLFPPQESSSDDI
ncbi:MAG: hypothetical protein RML93_02195 [Anaerolineales bacterium]|nr:hypothetical protein [Anaerolineales bacterium]MCS7247819.1 hypothetical protein [Anaerolineales bacterium]MDW8161629.1 hypothetical protein [Anaerolineales bacterium]MDW8446085.1 hypothetical protein [Anaerolineales bacterium]